MTQRRPRRRRRLEQEPVFGPLVVFGSGGAATGVLGDHVTRLTPLTDADADADEMIHAVRAAPLLSGDRGVPPRTPPRSRMRCCGSPGSPIIFLRSANSISSPSSQGKTASGAWTCGCGSARQSPGIPSCAGCAEHAAAHGQPAVRAAGHTGTTAPVQDRPPPGRGAVRAQARSGPRAITGAKCHQAVSPAWRGSPARCGCAARRGCPSR